MRAGYEIGVASTKAFIGQLTCLLLFALWLSKRRNIPLLLYNTLVDEMKNLPSKIEYILKTFINKNNKDLVLDRNAYTDHIKDAQTMFYL